MTDTQPHVLEAQNERRDVLERPSRDRRIPVADALLAIANMIDAGIATEHDAYVLRNIAQDRRLEERRR